MGALLLSVRFAEDDVLLAQCLERHLSEIVDELFGGAGFHWCGSPSQGGVKGAKNVG